MMPTLSPQVASQVVDMTICGATYSADGKVGSITTLGFQWERCNWHIYHMQQNSWIYNSVQMSESVILFLAVNIGSYF